MAERKANEDASITAQVKMTLLYHCSTSALNTKVETKRGVVTLYGKASNAAELDLATKLANDVNGVKGVKNQRPSSSPSTRTKRMYDHCQLSDDWCRVRRPATVREKIDRGEIL